MADENPKRPAFWNRKERKDGQDEEPKSGQKEIWEQPFAGYKVYDKIAQGGSGAVFLARDERLGRDVAIKALTPDLQSNENAVDLFFNEARNVARLRHPNIVRGYDVGRTGTYFYFVMEFVRGESLGVKLDRLDRHRLQEKEAFRIVREILKALQCVFETGLVHRDVKPGNILLGNNGDVKLCDLGIAREVAFATPEAVVMGSPSYASPEQVRGDCDIDIRADIYGLGCTWFHMITGQPPYRGETAQQVMQKHLDEEADLPSPRDLDPRLSAATSALIGWMMAKDREKRPRTPQQLLNKMREHPLCKMIEEEERHRDAIARISTPTLDELKEELLGDLIHGDRVVDDDEPAADAAAATDAGGEGGGEQADEQAEKVAADAAEEAQELTENARKLEETLSEIQPQE